MFLRFSLSHFMSFSPTFRPGASQRESTLTLNVNHTFSARDKALRSQGEDGDSMGWEGRRTRRGSATRWTARKHEGWLEEQESVSRGQKGHRFQPLSVLMKLLVAKRLSKDWIRAVCVTTDHLYAINNKPGVRSLKQSGIYNAFRCCYLSHNRPYTPFCPITHGTTTQQTFCISASNSIFNPSCLNYYPNNERFCLKTFVRAKPFVVEECLRAMRNSAFK